MTEERRRKKYESQVRSYRRKRAELIVVMGGECALCHDTEELEFDHPRGRDWKPKDHNRWVRLKRYAADWMAGRLRLLCRSCNGSLGARNIYMYEHVYEEPAEGWGPGGVMSTAHWKNAEAAVSGF